jgi:hypothetical protein
MALAMLLDGLCREMGSIHKRPYAMKEAAEREDHDSSGSLPDGP